MLQCLLQWFLMENSRVCVTGILHAGNASPASSADGRATVIRLGSGSSSDEEQSLPSPSVTPRDHPARAWDAASPGSINTIFDMLPGSPSSLGLGSPFSAGSPLSLGALGEFGDLALDADGFGPISPLPDLTTAITPPRLGTGTMMVFHAPPRGITSPAWDIGQTPASAGSDAGTPPQCAHAPCADIIFSPLPLLGSLAAQRLPAEEAPPSVPLQLTASASATTLEGVQASACGI